MSGTSAPVYGSCERVAAAADRSVGAGRPAAFSVGRAPLAGSRDSLSAGLTPPGEPSVGEVGTVPTGAATIGVAAGATAPGATPAGKTSAPGVPPAIVGKGELPAVMAGTPLVVSRTVCICNCRPTP